MQLKHIKSDVYHLIGGDYINCFLTEKELLRLIKDNDIADVYKTAIGWFVNHDLGQLPFHHYLKVISQNALDSLCIILNNGIYENQ
jgi:hypothetical protein